MITTRLLQKISLPSSFTKQLGQIYKQTLSLPNLLQQPHFRWLRDLTASLDHHHSLRKRSHRTAGIANTVRKYLPSRAVVPHATPFDLRVDQALALERRQQQAGMNDECAPFQWAGSAARSDK
ncbi:MAG: hypothetical protein WDW38_005841 [Sanguina aurantia]